MRQLQCNALNKAHSRGARPAVGEMEGRGPGKTCWEAGCACALQPCRHSTAMSHPQTLLSRPSSNAHESTAILCHPIKLLPKSPYAGGPCGHQHHHHWSQTLVIGSSFSFLLPASCRGMKTTSSPGRATLITNRWKQLLMVEWNTAICPDIKHCS